MKKLSGSLQSSMVGDSKATTYELVHGKDVKCTVEPLLFNTSRTKP